MLFKLSNLNSNLALTLGYLNPALNNSTQIKKKESRCPCCIQVLYIGKKNIIRKFHVVVLQGRQMKKSNVRAEVFFRKLFFEQFQYIRTFGLNGNLLRLVVFHWLLHLAVARYFSRSSPLSSIRTNESAGCVAISRWHSCWNAGEWRWGSRKCIRPVSSI